MLPTRDGSLRLFRCLGIDVYLHWSWFLIAFLIISTRGDEYSSPLWNVAEYLALFVIVLLHEYGHALSCRQTGGQAEQIVLWPLGGVAYVAPPQRPGAQLWSIAAGPLVNLVLAPLLFGALLWLRREGWAETRPNLFEWLYMINVINGLLLVFNLLPVYPLDGGQILRSLLWFWVGPVTSLVVATAVGLVGGLALVAFGWWAGGVWTMLIAAFLLFNCWRSFRFALAWRAQLRAGVLEV